MPDAATPSDPRPDELPAELDVTAYVGPYLFPDIRRRRIAGTLHAVVGAASLLGGVLSGNVGLMIAGAFLAAVAAYHFAAAWPLVLDQTDALAAASRAAAFPVGHASAQLGWRGLLSRPSWRILVYSGRRPAVPARPGGARRRRRRGARLLRRAQPRGLVRVRPRRLTPGRRYFAVAGPILSARCDGTGS